MTEQELANIFDEVAKEIVSEFDTSTLERELVQRFGVTQLNQKFLFRVLAKVLCKPRQAH